MTEIRAREDELSASLQALRRRREDLERQNEAIRQADRVKGEFLNNVSHELRTPLNGIIGFTELLRDQDVGRTPQEQVECLGYVLDASRQLLGLVDDLLAVASYEAGHFEVHPQAAQVQQVLEHVHGQLNDRMRMKSLSYEAHIDPGVTDVFTDVEKLSHLLFHLIDNAIKFTPPGGQVTVRVKADSERTFLVEVEDTGIGVPPEMQSELFRVFQQGDASLSRRHPGLGLGLALCKRIVEGEGGEIGARSTPGKGSTFFARLPRRLELPAVALEAHVPPRPPRVLIVDSEEHRQLLVSTLRRAGCDIVTVETGAAALDISMRESFDLMYTGLVLPDMSGLDLLKTLQQSPDHRDIPIVVLAQVAADQPGISIRDVLLPPYHAAEVLATLRHSLGDPAAPAPTRA